MPMKCNIICRGARLLKLTQRATLDNVNIIDQLICSAQRKQIPLYTVEMTLKLI